MLVGKDSDVAKGEFFILAQNGTNQKSLNGTPSGLLQWDSNDLGGSAIVAKSLDTNGYIKYASGLIVQWGSKSISGSPTDISFPISFNSYPGSIIVTPTGGYDIGNFSVVKTWGVTTSKFGVYSSPVEEQSVNWIAIGY